MKTRALRLPLILAILVAAGACSSTNDKPKPDSPQPVANGEKEPPIERLHEKPFTAHFDALLARHLPRGEFLPGQEAVFASIHSGLNASLYFIALRTKMQLYVNPEHDETFFVVSGVGTLDLPRGKKKTIDGGCVVRVPAKLAHGFTGSNADPLMIIMVASPAVNAAHARPADDDMPDALGAIDVIDVTQPDALKVPETDTFAIKKIFDGPSKRSTLQLSAIQRSRIPDHKHATHDETVIIFFQQGFGFLRLNEVVNPTEAVQIAHIPAGTVHSFEHKADGRALAVSIFSPRYDGSDVVLVEETRELQAPSGYKKTGKDEFIDDRDRRPDIKVGPQGRPR